MTEKLIGTIALCVATIGLLRAVGWVLEHDGTILVILGVLVIGGRWVWSRTENRW